MFTYRNTTIGEVAVNTVSDAIKQRFNNTCAVKSQQLILEKFGINIGERQLREEGLRHGWYEADDPATPDVVEGGTYFSNMGKLLNLHGVPTHHYTGCNIFNLINELAQGHQVIVSVDADELWHYGPDTIRKDIMEGETPNHALIVSGIDTSDPNNVKVVITDPGTGDDHKEYPLPQFMDAWKDSRFQMVTTDKAPPGTFDSFQSPDYTLPSPAPTFAPFTPLSPSTPSFVETPMPSFVETPAPAFPSFIEPTPTITHIPTIGEMPFNVFQETYAFCPCPCHQMPVLYNNFFADAFPTYAYTPFVPPMGFAPPPFAFQPTPFSYYPQAAFGFLGASADHLPDPGPFHSAFADDDPSFFG